MSLSVRPLIQSLPSYSLTSDLLGFLRCGLQYRYSRIGNMPASHPVQMWYGQFIHAVLEESYRQIQEGRKPSLPMSQTEINDIMDQIDRRLAARNIQCWDDESEKLGRLRATAAVNELGPLLFPLINQAEVRVRGARKLPATLKGIVTRNIERYEMLGVIDVVTHVELFSKRFRNNTVLELVVEALPSDPPQEFEVIVDYKGMKRPEEKGSGLWDIYEWQVHTYASLRKTLTSRPIIAGVLIYLNELVPTKTDFMNLRRAIREKQKDFILPDPGSDDERLLMSWKAKDADEKPPLLSLEYRLKRAIRVIPITDKSIDNSLRQFDNTVARIEKCIADEAKTGQIIKSWERNADHEPTCEACDSKTYCPEYKTVSAPKLPGYKI